MRRIATSLRPVITDGHLAMARAVGVDWVALNNDANLSMMRKLAGNPIEVWPLDPVTLIFGQVGVTSALHPMGASPPISCSVRSASSFCQRFGRLPTRKDAYRGSAGLFEN